jgi:hypothetical protein
MSTRALPSPAWTLRQAAYMGWLATPSWLRSPDTEKAFSESFHVNVATLRRWRKLPGFMPAVRKAALETLGELYADVVHKIEEEAAKGSLQHQKLYLPLVGADAEDAIEDAAFESLVEDMPGVDLARMGRADRPILNSAE